MQFRPRFSPEPEFIVEGKMDVSKILTELRAEREQIDDAILSLERLAQGRGRKRGRPPAYMSMSDLAVPKRRGRPPGSKNKVQAANTAANAAIAS